MLVASIVVVLFLPLAGLIIERAYTASLDSRLEEQLKIQTYSLMGLADELELGVLWLPEALPDERFNQLASGRYAQLFAENGETLWRSLSVASIELPERSDDSAGLMTDEQLGQFQFKRIILSDDTPLQVAEVGIIWEGPGDVENVYTFQVSESLVPYYFEIEAFRQTLILWLGGLGALLLLVNLAAMFWALRPFQRLSEAIVAVESGEADYLDSDYPKELQQIADNINGLIVHERRQRKRYRNTLQDLAHSLKTPLSVLQSLIPEISNKALIEPMNEQSERMNRLISYQLQRAVISGSTPVKQRTALKAEVERLFQALAKVYLDKRIRFESDISEGCILFVEANDALEVIGNLCDNACKYGESMVRVNASMSDEANMIAIDVIDNGPGIPTTLRESIFERGKRLDENNTEGQGIGLAVVQDIVTSYRGEIAWPEQTSGHCVRLLLPGVIEATDNY